MFLFVFCFLNIQPAWAASQRLIKILNSSEGSSSKVEVKNSFNSSNTNVSSTNSSTHIRIETNGEVKEYNSEKVEDIKLESSDGSAKVYVNTSNNSSSNNNTSITLPASPTIAKQIEEKKEEIKKKLEEKKEEIKKKVETQKAKIVEERFDLREFLDHLFSFSWF